MFAQEAWSATGFVILAVFLAAGIVLLAAGSLVAGAICLGLGIVYVPIRAHRARLRS